MTFLDFLKNLMRWKKAADRGEQPRTAVAVWAKIDLPRLQLDGPPSPRGMAIYFQLMRWVVGPGPRSLALDLLEQWYATTPPCRFAHVEIGRFVMELALRIVDPATLDQGSTELCGATGPVYSYLCSEPQGYATLATSLVSTGRGRFGGYVVEATPWILARTIPDRMTSADYVVLTCVRAVISATGVMESVVQSTQPVTLVRIFERMGYQDIRVSMMELEEQITTHRRLAFDDSVVLGFRRTMALAEHGITTRPGTTRPSFEGSHLQRMRRAQAHLMEAIGLLNGGQHVLVVAIHPDLAEHVINLRPLRVRPGQELALHWVVIEELTIVGHLDVRITMVTWGRRKRATVSQSHFFNLYYGFIAARP